MKKQLIMLTVMAALLFTAAVAFCAAIFPGYAGTRWGAGLDAISKTYRNGTLGRIGDQIIYKQIDPDKMIRQRTFGFKNDGLNAVSITFNGAYVKKTGVETILAKFIKIHGDGNVDRSSAPHLISYTWEDAATRMTFAYSATKPDMTVLMLQQK